MFYRFIKWCVLYLCVFVCRAPWKSTEKNVSVASPVSFYSALKQWSAWRADSICRAALPFIGLQETYSTEQPATPSGYTGAARNNIRSTLHLSALE